MEPPNERLRTGRTWFRALTRSLTCQQLSSDEGCVYCPKENEMKKASTTKHTQEAVGSSIPTNEKSDSGRNKIFDDIARVIGSNIPRRKALKLAVAGLAGAALVELGIRPAWAFETCDCNGQSYDTDVSCCTPSGVQQKHPIVDLNACPNKVAHPGFTAVPNGCGPSGSV